MTLIRDHLAHCEVIDGYPTRVGRLLWCTPILDGDELPDLRSLRVDPGRVYIEVQPVSDYARYVVWADGKGYGVMDDQAVRAAVRRYRAALAR